jgi:4-amino-4-deoxy-L-arabinose transferase-like glycosyltransferase
MHTPPRRALSIIALVAVAHAALFAIYQKPEWDSSWDDQVGYQRLAHALATTGTFTRNPEVRPFVPETIRTPVYPLFVAAVYRLAGESHAAVAAAQALLFALLTLLVFAIASRLTTERVALAAAAFTALFPPIPYYGALVLTEVLCTVLVTTGMWFTMRALQSSRVSEPLLAGVFFGLATLTRPNFVLLAPAIVGSIALIALWRGEWRSLLRWSGTLVAFAAILAPWIAFNAIYVHRWTISPAGGLGRATWEASWQGTWPGGLQADLTRLAEAHIDDDDTRLDELVTRFANANEAASAPMLRYVHQWRDIRRIWDTPTDPRERSLMRVAADDEYWRVGLDNIRQDRIGYFVRRITVGSFVLWAAEVPIRRSHINTTSKLVVRGFWLVQAAAMALAILGLLFVAARHGILLATPLAALIVYVTVVHVPLLAEARYSLPAKPVVLALAAIALAELLHRVLPDTGDYLP